MHTRKIHWAIWAALWLGIMVGGFFYLEVPALVDDLGITLSQTLADLAHAWPPGVFFAGLFLGIVIGTLVTHILWTWVPKQKRAECGECRRTILLSLLALLLLWPAPTRADGRSLILPNLTLTPGVARPDVTDVCRTRWGRDQRHVTAAMKREVFARYGLTGNSDPACTRDKHGRKCEIDHLISRELGGADDVDNLWPQPYGGQPWNAGRKDRVENRLHKAVCEGEITLEQAQEEIRTDYRIPYRRYFGEPE